MGRGGGSGAPCLCGMSTETPPASGRHRDLAKLFRALPMSDNGLRSAGKGQTRLFSCAQIPPSPKPVRTERQVLPTPSSHLVFLEILGLSRWEVGPKRTPTFQPPWIQLQALCVSS
ncbi:X-ray repair cross-complementing protein 5 [Platysternon megacephalum]|uniref:X-ray repair cross-complementing protein 5 n=1 Tax=Platysternon megacephalum TaxID=55544 RepID=A0A4D9E866_9SAUR|nr:X-ray repair cross-complementing protein 5 [Platysternon megacephalum]